MGHVGEGGVCASGLKLGRRCGIGLSWVGVGLVWVGLGKVWVVGREWRRGREKEGRKGNK